MAAVVHFSNIEPVPFSRSEFQGTDGMSMNPSGNLAADPSEMAPQRRRKRKWRVFATAICVGALLWYGTALHQRLTCTWQISRAIRGFVAYGYHETEFSPDGNLIAIAHAEKSKVLDWATGKEVSTLEGYDGRGISAFSWDGRIVSLFPEEKADDRKAFIWNALSGRLVTRLKLPEQIEVRSCSPFFSPDNKKVVAICGSGLIIWDSLEPSRTGRINITQNKDPWLGTFMSWCPVTHEMTAVDADGKLLNVDLHKEMARPLLVKQKRAVKAARWSPDGTRLVTIDREDGTASIWDVQAGAVTTTLPGKNVVYACFSPNGERIVTMTKRSDVLHKTRGTPLVWDRRTCVWDAKSGQMIHQLPTTAIVSFSPDWSFWIDAGPEGLRIARFDGSELCALPDIFDGHGSICIFSKDNRRVAYVNGSGLVIVLQHHDPIRSWPECFTLYETWMLLLAAAGLAWCMRGRKNWQAGEPNTGAP